MYVPYVIQIICNNPQDLVKQYNLISIKNSKQYDGHDQEICYVGPYPGGLLISTVPRMNHQLVNIRIRLVYETKMLPPREKGWGQRDEKLSNFGD